MDSLLPGLEHLGRRRVVVSISGGKDSGALSLWLKAHGIEHDRVFLDTGWEHPDTYAYLKGELARVLGPITWLRAEKQMAALILSKAMFPSRVIRFCTEELKVSPMQAYLNAKVAAGEELVNAVGIRREESKSRSESPEWEWSEGFDCEVWRPLVNWTERHVIEMHAHFGLRPNPLYLKGAQRVGCWPCIYARKDEIRRIAELDPARIDLIRDLEQSVIPGAKARWERDRISWEADPSSRPPQGSDAYKKKHARLFERPFSPPTFFQSGTPDSSGHYPMLSIDEVVAWSKTSRGGKQFEMFAAAGRDEGCMRWGLCDTGKKSTGE